MKPEIDFTYLKTVSGGDESFELQMLESLRSEIDEKMHQMQVSIGNNPDGVRLQAHSLKNLYGILGIASLKEEFYLFEKNGVAMPVEILSQRFLHCYQDWQQSKSALDSAVLDYKSRLQ